MCTVHRNRTFSRRYITNVYCAQKQNTIQTVQQKCLLCTEKKICRRYNRNRPTSRRYIRKEYCAQKQKTFRTVHHKCVMRTETEHFPDCTSQMYNVHRKREHSIYGTSVMCTVHRILKNSRRFIRNVYCAQKQITFQTLHQKCVLCTETEQVSGGTSEMCTVHRKRTCSRRYFRNV